MSEACTEKKGEKREYPKRSTSHFLERGGRYYETPRIRDPAQSPPLENVILCRFYSLRLRLSIFMTFQISSVSNTVVVVDEIGKMELFSQSFVNLVRELFASPQATILATVPITKQRPIPFVDELKCREDVTLIEVT